MLLSFFFANWRFVTESIIWEAIDVNINETIANIKIFSCWTDIIGFELVKQCGTCLNNEKRVRKIYNKYRYLCPPLLHLMFGRNVECRQKFNDFRKTQVHCLEKWSCHGVYCYVEKFGTLEKSFYTLLKFHPVCVFIHLREFQKNPFVNIVINREKLRVRIYLISSFFKTFNFELKSW